MNPRGPWQGMWSIARFNWPFYLAAALVTAGALAVLFCASPIVARWAAGLVLAGALYFLVGSLGVSHVVYDLSDLYRWNWLGRALRGASAERVILCHSGFDEVSLSLRAKLNPTDLVVLDHFDAQTMTEASIRRARRLYPPVAGTQPAVFDRWPSSSHSADVIFGLLAIHELRSEAERIAWFAEARRCLAPGGRVVVLEHTRDLANFLAFGPGFLHFHSPASWRRCWEAAGLRAADEFRITPWVRVFNLQAP
jgi:SAM-dependent methyltransferase